MAEILSPRDAGEVRETIAWALAAGRRLEVKAGGTKHALGRPVEADCVLDLSRISGVECYEPEELILTARAATPLKEIEAALSACNQQLAFEPADLGPLFGAAPRGATLGGVIACNLSGPRRIKAFAARDHFLGVKGVSGRAGAFKAGGRVVKNVTGYDLCKLLAGSYGTLAVMTEITVRVAPAPETTRTMLVFGLDEAKAVELLGAAMRTPHEVSGAAHLPAPVASRSTVERVAQAGASLTALRVEGIGPSVGARSRALREEFGHAGAVEELKSQDSMTLWREVQDVSLLGRGSEGIIWRLSLAPSRAPEAVARLRREVGALGYYDWAGGLVWLALSREADAAEEAVRQAVAAAGGHALLLRASPEIRRRAPVFQPQPPALARLTARVKESFDPEHVLNPGRMYEGL